MSESDAAPEGAAPNGQGQEPGIRILAQFIRDLSMENPRAPEALRPSPSQPQIDLNVEMNARGREDGFFEVDLKLSASAKREDGPLFIVELLYGGVFQISGVPGEDIGTIGSAGAVIALYGSAAGLTTTGAQLLTQAGGATEANDAFGVELAAGDYTLLCNIVEKSEHEAHAHEGMVLAFRVS